MKLIQSVLAATLLTPVAAMAADGSASDTLSYSWLELDYVNLDIDQVGDDGNIADDFDNGGGLGLKGSVELGTNWFLFANYSNTEADVNFIDDQDQFVPGDTDIKKVDLGFGFHSPLGDMTDLVFRAAYSDVDRDKFSFGSESSDDSLDDLNDDNSDGYFADVSVRSQLTEGIEGSIGARYTDFEDVDGVSIIGNILFELSPSLGLNIGVDAGDELAIWNAGVRFSF